MKWYDRLFFALEKAGKSQSQLAAAAKVAPPTVTQWKNGEVQTLDAIKCYYICIFLGIRQEWLLFGEEPMRSSSKKPIQDLTIFLEALTEEELEKAINVLQAALGKSHPFIPSRASRTKEEELEKAFNLLQAELRKPRTHHFSKPDDTLSPEEVEAKYFPFNKTEKKENETTFKTGTHNRKTKNRS